MQPDATLSTGGFTKGENSRDLPTDLEAGQWAEVVNLIPGDEAASPRGGCSTVAAIPGADSIDWVFPFRTTAARKMLIAKRFSDLVQIDIFGGTISTLVAGAFPSEKAVPCAVRAGDAVIVNSDYPSGGTAYSVTEVSGSLVASPANIRRPDSVTVLVASNDVAAVKFPSRSTRMACVTFVKRTDSVGIDGSGISLTTSSWADVSAESWERIEDRGFFEGADVDAETGNRITIVCPEMPAGATHVRVWATQMTEWETVGSKDASLQVSAGASRRFIRDVAVNAFFGGAYSFDLDLTEGQLAGQTHLSDTVGANEIPPAKVLKYHNGLLWATGAQFGDSPGRSYYSYPIDGLPSRMLTLFNVSDRCIDTALDDTERTMGIAASRGNLFFINENDVWLLRDGNPENDPVLIAQGMGTTFPQTIVERGQAAFYLSNQGPAMISGETIELLQEFAHGAIWPKPASGAQTFFGLQRALRKQVKAWWYQDNLFITGPLPAGGATCACLRAKEGGPAPWTMRLADGSGVAMTNFAWYTDNEAYLVCDGAGSTGTVARFLGKAIGDGSGYYYTASATSRALHTDRRRKWHVGEAIWLLARAKWADAGQMLLTIRGQWGRIGVLFQYSQRPVTESQQNTDVSNAWRELVLQALPEGLVGAWFQPGFSKVVRGAFSATGLDVALIQRDGHEFEYISLTEAEDIPSLDTGLSIFDDRFNGGDDG